DRSNDGIEVVDPETGRFLDVNQTSCLSLGYTREEMLALQITDVAMSFLQNPAAFKNAVASIREMGFKITEEEHRRKDGTILPVEVNVKYIDLDRGYLVAIVRDITERKQAQELLQRAEEKYRSIFKNAIEGIFQSTPEGRFLVVNPAMARIAGYKSAE